MATLVSKSNAASMFNSNVRSSVSQTYSSSNLPSPWSGYSSNMSSSSFGSTPGNMSSSDFGGSVVTASTFVSNISSQIYNNLSQIRYIRIIHRNTGDNTNINGDSTYTACLNTGYRQGISLSQSSMGVSSGSLISSVNWSSAYSAQTAVRRNTAFTITNTIHVSHSSHSSHSDHGSRVRR